jgi:hypothetical protein
MNKSRRIHLVRRWNSLTLWEQWVMATVASETVGLILIVAIGSLSRNLDLNLYALLTLLGAIEGIALGFAQWIVLRHYIRHAGWWILATSVGAMIAWFAGLFVSTVLAIAAVRSSPSDQAALLLPGILMQGIGVGVLLGYAQWLVLQSHIRHQIWRKTTGWLLANAIAWVLALFTAFIGAEYLNATAAFSIQTAMAAAVTGGVMGAIVGTITGIALVWLLKPRSS